MMSSSQIAQQNHHAFSMGYGSNPGANSYEGLTGFTPFGHGAGTQAGVNMMGGMNTAVNTASLTGLGALGGKALLSKLGLGATGAARGLAAVATMTGATLPAALGLGLMLPAMAAVGGMHSGAQQYARTQGVMDQTFGNRVGMGGSFGFGVGRDDALRMTEAMRSLKAVPEMMTSMGELQDVMQSVSKMGILQSSRNATEFKDKFISMTRALRDMSRDLGSTMKEATALFESSVGQGFLDVNQATVNARMAKSASAVGIGMSTNRMMGLQTGGASMLRSMGADSRAGAFGARDIASALSVANMNGVVSSQDILRITGKVGEEGVASLSQQLMQAQVQMFQNTGAGRFITASLAERGEDGRFTGNLDKDMLSDLRSGKITGEGLMSRGREMLSGLSDVQALSFRNAMGRGMGAKAGALAGAGGGANAISAILGEMGAKNEEARRALVQQLTGASQAHADVMLDMAKNISKINDDRNNEMLQAAVRDRSASFFKERMISGQLHHATTQVQSILVDPIQSVGARHATRMGHVFDDITDEFVTGSTASKINTLLNPGMYAYNAGRLLFSDPSTHKMSQRGRRAATSRFFRGNVNLPTNNNEGRSLNSIFMDNERRRESVMGGALSEGLSAGGMVTAGLAVASIFAAPVTFTVAALAGATTLAGFTAGSAIRKGMDRYIDNNTAGSVYAFGEGEARTLGDLRGQGNYSGEFKNASLAQFRKQLREHGDIGQLQGKSMSDIVAFLGTLGKSSEWNANGVDVLKAAAEADDEGHAGSLLSTVTSMMSSSAGDISVADAESSIKGLTSSSLHGGAAGIKARFFGFDALTWHEGNFASTTTQGIALGGEEGKQKVILKILRDQGLASRIARNKGNKKQLRQINKELGDVLTMGEITSLAEELSAINGDYDALIDVADGLEAAMGRINLADQRDVAEAALSSVRDSYGSAGGKVANLLQSKGLFSSVNEMSSAVLSSTGGGGRMDNLRRALVNNRFKGDTEKSLLEKMKKAGVTRKDLESAGIMFDDDLTEKEGLTASRLLALDSDLSSEIGRRTSAEGQRADKLGLTKELQLEIAKAYESAIEASKDSLIEHQKYQQVTRAEIKQIENRVIKMETAGK